MNEVLTVAEIRSRFGSEWILVGDPQTDSDLNVRSGRVLAHSHDRDQVYRRAATLKPASFALLFTGTVPEDAAIVL